MFPLNKVVIKTVIYTRPDYTMQLSKCEISGIK